MTYSQINHAKAWGFSRRSLNLNHFGQGRERFNVTSANTSNPHERSQLSSKSVITWLKTNGYFVTCLFEVMIFFSGVAVGEWVENAYGDKE